MQISLSVYKRELDNKVIVIVVDFTKFEFHSQHKQIKGNISSCKVEDFVFPDIV